MATKGAEGDATDWPRLVDEERLPLLGRSGLELCGQRDGATGPLRVSVEVLLA